jgi:outer membrane autotransporter protein
LIGWMGEQDGPPAGAGAASSLDWSLQGLQLGLELYRNRNPDGAEELDEEAHEEAAAERHHAGVAFAIARMEGDADAGVGQAAGDAAVDAYSLSGYWTKYGEKGGYLDAVVQAAWYDYSVRSALPSGLEDDGFGAAVAVEIGKPIFLQEEQGPQPGWILEPQGQLLYQVFDEAGAGDEAGRVRFEDTESLLGRVGLRLANTRTGGSADRPRMSRIGGRINAWHELMSPPRAVFPTVNGSAPVVANLGDRWLEINAGVTAQLSSSATLYADGGYLWDTAENGDALHGRIGARWNW